jgi:hypothetical protein
MSQTDSLELRSEVPTQEIFMAKQLASLSELELPIYRMEGLIALARVGYEPALTEAERLALLDLEHYGSFSQDGLRSKEWDMTKVAGILANAQEEERALTVADAITDNFCRREAFINIGAAGYQSAFSLAIKAMPRLRHEHQTIRMAESLAQQGGFSVLEEHAEFFGGGSDYSLGSDFYARCLGLAYAHAGNTEAARKLARDSGRPNVFFRVMVEAVKCGDQAALPEILAACQTPLAPAHLHFLRDVALLLENQSEGEKS